MIITLCGENAFTRRQALADIRQKFAVAHGSSAVEYYEASALTPALLRELSAAQSLFTPERLLIVAKPSDNKELFAALAEVIPTIQEGTTLVLVEDTLDKRTKTYKMLKSATDFREFGLLSDSQVQKWVSEEVRARGGEISTSVVHQLLERVGNDQWQLANEIAKLVAFAPKITADNVERLVTPNLQVSAFALLDAVMAGNQQRATALLRQLKVRSDPYEFFGLLVWQVHALALISSAPPMSGAQLAQASGLKPFVIQKTQGLARQLGLAQVRGMAATLARLDMQLKSTGVEPWLLVEQALARLTKNPSD